MYPQGSNQHNPGIKQRLPLQKLLLFGIPLLLFIGIIWLILINTTDVLEKRDLPKYDLSKTELQAEQNFGYLQGDELYAYNGFSFYAINIKTGATTILSSGQRLPLPDTIHWGTKGALMNFSSSFSLTPVEPALRRQGRELDIVTQQFVWYMDFASGDIRVASSDPLLADIAYYSERDNGFYYIPDQSTYPEPKTPLMFYNIDSNKTETIVENMGLVDVNAIMACPDTEKACVILRHKDDVASEKLIAVSRGGEQTTLIDSGGQLFATNDATRYIVVERENNEAQRRVDDNPTEVGHAEEADMTEDPAKLRDFRANKTYELDFTVGASEPKMHFVDDKRFYVIDNTLSEEVDSGRQAPLYRSGELSDKKATSATYPLTFKDAGVFTSQFAGTSSHGKGSTMLLTTVEGNQLLLGDTSVKLTPKSPSRQDVEAAIKECVATSGAQDSQYLEDSRLFRILITDSSSFTANIKRFSQCLAATKVSPLYGYSLQFSGVDASNGRISTD